MSELYLPSKLVEELAEERAVKLARLQDNPLAFHDNQIRLATLSGASGNPSDIEALLREVKGWVAIGVGAVADRLSGLALAAYAKGSEGEDDVILSQEHRANTILDNPNPVFPMQTILGLTAWWLKLTGQAYYQVLHDSAGIPQELWPMPPNRVFPVPSSTGVVGGFTVLGTSGEEVFLETSEVIRIWRPDPLDMYSPLGALSPQATEFNAERFRVSHIEQTYKNDASPRLVLEGAPGESLPNDTEYKAFGTKWRDAYHRRKGQRQGIPAILPPGFKAHELGQAADGSMTVEMGKQLRDQLLAAMGVPGSIVGLVQDVNRAAAETNQYTFDKHGVMPSTKLIESALTHQLARQFDPDIVYKFEEFLMPDKDFELREEEVHLRTKVRAPNEVRAKHGLDDVDWGALPVGSFNDVPYTGEDLFNEDAPNDLGDPVNTPNIPNSKASNNTTGKFDEGEALTANQVLNGAQVSSIVQVALSVQLGELGLQAAIEILGVSFGIEPGSAKKMLGAREAIGSSDTTVASSGVTDDMREAFSRANAERRMLVNERKYTSKFTRAISQVFKAQADVIVERFRKANPTPRVRASQIDDLFLDGEFNRMYSINIEGLRERIYLDNAQSTFGLVSPGKTFSFLDTQRKVLVDLGADSIVRIDTTTKARITRALTEGTSKGESVDQIAKRISSSIISRKRARTIARTEVGKASQAAQQESFVQADVVESKRWNNSRDNFVRHSHDNVIPNTVRLDEQFRLGSGAAADYPLDPSLSPEDLINCRCFLTPVFTDR